MMNASAQFVVCGNAMVATTPRPVHCTVTKGRNPQARWTTTPGDVRELSEVQKKLLAHVAGSLKPGGRLIYAVCTLTNPETLEVADAITRQFPDLQPLEFLNPAKRNDPPKSRLFLWPQEIGGNEMFICAWQKTK